MEIGRFHGVAERLGGRLERAWPLKGGVSARTTALEIGGEDGLSRVVVREPQWDQPGLSARREFAVVSAAHQMGVPTPRPLLLDADGDLLGRPALVLTYVDGATEFNPTDLPGTTVAMARQLAAIHTCQIPPGLRPHLQDRAARLAETLAARPDRADETIDESAVRAALAGHRPTSSNPAGLLHGDFWPGNVLWKDGVIAAVIDWEDAAFGDPLYDAATTRLDVLWAYGWDAMEQFTQAYAEAAPEADLSALPWFDLVAALRPAGQISLWAGAAPDPAAYARHMRERLVGFREQALAGLWKM